MSLSLKNLSAAAAVTTALAAIAVFSSIAAVYANNPPPNKDLARADAALSSVQKRIALVIGNKDYESAPLKNPVNDANAMAQELKDLGFEVILRTNVTKRQMREAVDEFAAKLGPNTIGLFYFSGHGVQVDGVNYLVPLSYHIERQADVEDEAYPAQRLLDTMGGSGCLCNIVILDACRNNSLPKSLRDAGDRGLGKMDAPSGTFIAYATAPGKTASDDPNKDNGLYTGVLLEKMKTPGLKIEDVFKATLVSVAKVSGEKQVPWVESSLRTDFYFAAGVPAPAPKPVPVPTSIVTSGEAVDLTARLSLTGLPPGARVEVDGQKLTETEYSVDLPRETTKDVTVLVEADGYRPLSRRVTLKRGTLSTLPLPLVAVAPAVVPVSNPLPNPAPVSSPTEAADAANYVQRGNDLFLSEKYDEALIVYSLAIAADLNNAENYDRRGKTFNVLKKYDKAIEDFSDAIRLKPRGIAYYESRIITYKNLNQYDKVIDDQTEIIHIRGSGLFNPVDLAPDYTKRGDTYIELKQYDKAVTDYTDAIKCNAEYASAYLQRADAFYNLNQYDTAIADWTKFLQLRPNDPAERYVRKKMSEAQAKLHL